MLKTSNKSFLQYRVSDWLFPKMDIQNNLEAENKQLREIAVACEKKMAGLGTLLELYQTGQNGTG
jgi:hypothetical protein